MRGKASVAIGLALGVMVAQPALGQAAPEAAAAPSANPATPPAATGVGTPFELAYWQSIDSTGNLALYSAYLARYPGGTFAEIAQAKITALRAHGVPAPATPAATRASADPAPAAAGAGAGASGGTLEHLLAALADSQGSGHAAPATPAAAVAIPPRPAAVPVPPMVLPASFCSAEARNAFHAQVYVPAVDAAKANNAAALGYVNRLQALYDEHQLSGDATTLNAIAAAAQGYQPVAQAAFAAQAALVRQFAALMAVPITGCGKPGEPPATVAAK